MSWNELPPDDILQRIWDRIIQHHQKCGYHSLSRRERVWWCIWTFFPLTTNGGFHSYFTCTAGEDFQDLLDSLIAIEAPEYEKAARELCSSFDGGWPSANEHDRNLQMESIQEDDFRWPDDLVIDIDRVLLRLWRFWIANRDEV